MSNYLNEPVAVSRPIVAPIEKQLKQKKKSGQGAVEKPKLEQLGELGKPRAGIKRSARHGMRKRLENRQREKTFKSIHGEGSKSLTKNPAKRMKILEKNTKNQEK